MATFCNKCGASLVPKTPPRFDIHTGEKVNEMCPTNQCDHFGVGRMFSGGHVGQRVGGWFLGGGKCSECGGWWPVYD